MKFLFLRLGGSNLVLINDFLQVDFVDVDGHTIGEKEWPIDGLI